MKFANLLLLIVCLIALILAPGLEKMDYFLAVSAHLIGFGATSLLISTLKSPIKSGATSMGLGFTFYYWVGFPIKTAILLHVPEVAWVVPRLVKEAALVRELSFGLLVGAIGYAILIISIVTSRKGTPVRWRPASIRPNIDFALLVVAGFIIFKYWSKGAWNLGVPGMEPTDLGIPMLAGVLALLTDVGALLFVNVLLFFAFFSRSDARFGLALLLSFANAIVDLSFGLKDGIIFQTALLAVYGFIIKKFGGKDIGSYPHRLARAMIPLVGVAGVSVIVLYKYVNQYRFALLSGASDLGSAVSAAAASEAANSSSSFLAILNRINGAELVATVSLYRDHLIYGVRWTDYLDGAMTVRFTELIIGPGASGTAFGMTQFGYFYVLGGWASLIIGTFLLGKLFIFAHQRFMQINAINELRLASLPVLWILLIKVLLGSGNIILFIKELAVFYLAYGMLFLFFRRKTRRYRHIYNRKNYA